MTPKKKTVRVLGVDLPWNAVWHRYRGETRMGLVEVAPISATSAWHRAYWCGGTDVAEGNGPQRTASAATKWLLRAEKKIRGGR